MEFLNNFSTRENCFTSDAATVVWSVLIRYLKEARKELWNALKVDLSKSFVTYKKNLKMTKLSHNPRKIFSSAPFKALSSSHFSPFSKLQKPAIQRRILMEKNSTPSTTTAANKSVTIFIVVLLYKKKFNSSIKIMKEEIFGRKINTNKKKEQKKLFFNGFKREEY